MNRLALLAGAPALTMAMTGPADAFTYHPQGTTFVGGGRSRFPTPSVTP